MRRALACLLVSVLLACGPSPEASNATPPSGTLVVVIKQGPKRVPFEPKVARIQRANQQLGSILGRSIQIELDGSLLPQTHEGAEDVIARLVEDVARDLDDLAKEDPREISFAKEHFERLVVRYAPAEAAAREDRWRRGAGAKLDLGSKTVDVVRAEARWRALDRGEVATVLHRAFGTAAYDRYDRVLPDALPAREHASWFDYHGRGGHLHAREPRKGREEPHARVGSIDALRVRGMVMLHGLTSDPALKEDTLRWLIDAASDFATTYHHHAAEVERAPPGSPFREAEAAYVRWLRAELPRMTLEQRGKIASHLWITDNRKDHGERDRFASWAFPGIDLMAFSFDTIDAWIAAGHPPKPGTHELPAVFDTVVCPVVMESHDGRLRFSRPGRCDATFYEWALVDRAREDALVKGVIARADAPFAMAAFGGARRSLRAEADYLRFLRRFEGAPALWRVGADMHREVVYRPSAALLDESRRLWREVPAARGHALLWFARHAEVSYHVESDWADMLQGSPADDAALDQLLALGRDGFEVLPVAWRAVAKSPGRVRVVTRRALAALDDERWASVVVGKLEALARALCEEPSVGELAELRAFAQAELPKRPGAGLSRVVEAADPSACKPKRPPPAKPRAVERKDAEKLPEKRPVEHPKDGGKR